MKNKEIIKEIKNEIFKAQGQMVLIDEIGEDEWGDGTEAIPSYEKQIKELEKQIKELENEK